MLDTARAQADIDARRAAIKRLRLVHDLEYRDRYREYLRGKIQYRDMMAGIETHEEWYARVHP